MQVNKREYLPSREKNIKGSYYNETFQLHPEHGEIKQTRCLWRRLHWPENTASALCGPVGFSQASGTSD